MIVSIPKAPPELRQANRCPWSVIPSEAWGWLEAWRRWRHTGLGPLGEAGLGDEPASVSEAILACEEAARQGERVQELEAMAMMQGLGMGGRPAGGE